MEKFLQERIEQHNEVFERMFGDVQFEKTVQSVAEEIFNIMKQKKQLLLCGNGGSAADAQHIAAEFVSRFFLERQGMNAEALTVNTSVLTAIANDYDFEKVFARQVEAKGRKGDMLIGTSTSGTSNNVVEALRYAKQKGIITVMLTGKKENQELDEICDYLIKVPSNITPRIQEAHIFIGHLLAEWVEAKMVEEAFVCE